MQIETSHPSHLVRALGWAGLLPFVGLTALLWIVDADLRPWLTLALASYAALIATFLGGIHWGLAALRPESKPESASGSASKWAFTSERSFHYVWGIVPSLVAWLALIMPADAGLPLLAALLMACAAVDRTTYPAVGWAAWLPMRMQLTAVATLSCLLGAGAL